MSVHFNVTKAYFFDRPIVREMDKTAARVLSRFGAFVRTRARTLLNKSGTQGQPTSKPGQPPLKHEGTLRQFLFFAYDPFAAAVVIGPEKTNQVFFGQDGQPVRGTVPEVLEYGGSITILEALYRVPQANGEVVEKWMRADLRSKRRLSEMRKRMRTVRIEARPYMTPAFERELPKLREWKRAA